MRKVLAWWRGVRWRFSRRRMDEIAEAMYYEQADRDGVEYPPQWRGR